MAHELLPSAPAPMTAWAAALDESGCPALGFQLGVNRAKRDEQLLESQLPQLMSVPIDLIQPNRSSVLEQAFEQLRTDLYWVDVVATDGTRDRIINASAKEACNYIYEQWDMAQKITVKEYYPNILSGNVFIGSLAGPEPQSFNAELATGNHGQLVGGFKKPEYNITRTATGVFRCVAKDGSAIKPDSVASVTYNNETTECTLSLYENSERSGKNTVRVIDAVNNLIIALPKDGRDLLPGYYEFIVTWGGKVIFIEYQRNKAYDI